MRSPGPNSDKPADRDQNRRSWNRKIATSGGPVAYLNIYDGQEAVRIPEELSMGDGVYRYFPIEGIYRWTATS